MAKNQMPTNIRGGMIQESSVLQPELVAAPVYSTPCLLNAAARLGATDVVVNEVSFDFEPGSGSFNCPVIVSPETTTCLTLL